MEPTGIKPTDFKEAIHLLQETLTYTVPTYELIDKFIEIREEMLSCKESPEKVFIVLIGLLSDGLKYGNWPK